MKRQRESELKSTIVKWLNLQPETFAYTNITIGIPNGVGGYRRNQNRGAADICGVKGGRAFAIEVKTEKGKLSEYQQNWLGKFDAAGGYACIVREFGDAAEAWKEI